MDNKTRKDASSKKPTTTKTNIKVKLEKNTKSTNSSDDEPLSDEAKSKNLSVVQQIDRAIQSFRWWDVPQHESGNEWNHLEHRGVLFADRYVPHNIKPLYDGKPVDLTPELEELFTFYCQVSPEGPQLSNPKTAKIFNENYWRDLSSYLGPEHIIKDFNKIDFTPIRDYLNDLKEIKKQKTKEDKLVDKTLKLRNQLQYGYAFVDNHLEKLGNYAVEPPGLFRGRGEHPKMGKIKLRVYPEQMTLNIGAEDPVPPVPIPGHHWGNIVCKQDSTWLAGWTENIMGAYKYIFLSPGSSFRGKSDFEKYEKARKLKEYIDRIRGDYTVKMKSKELLNRQLGVAVFIIDKLALRVGGEKGEDEADTVGCCSLRVEHLSFEKIQYNVQFDFLGKDSMRYFQTVDFSQYGDIGLLAYNNLKAFCSKKNKSEEVFEQLNVQSLNNYLQSIMPGLTAKVFRTYNASITLQQELKDLDDKNMPSSEQVRIYNDANRSVAILCNHQRTAPKTFDESLEKIQIKIDLHKSQIDELKQMLEQVKVGKSIKLKDTTLEDKELISKQSHLFSKQPTEIQVQKRIELFRSKLKTLESTLRNKQENKSVALGTSKLNYMDPRITVAWCKRNDVPIEKIFPRALRDKFPWAMSVVSTWKF